MKRILSVTGILTLTLIILTSFSLRENPQDPPRGKKVKKHIKMVKVDEDGKKMELDTIIEGENTFVWNNDTIGAGHELKWVSKDGGEFDFDMDMDFDIEVEEGEDGKVIIMKSAKGGAPMIHEFKMDGDSAKKIMIKMSKDGKHGDHDVMLWNSEEGNEMIFHAPHVVGVPHAPKVVRIKKQKSGNVIDLSDPGIISYDKKEMRDGREKITIIREKPEERANEIHEEVIIHGESDHSMMIHETHPNIKKKEVKVIKDDNGNISIYENGKLTEIKEGDGKAAFITEEGNVFHIKESKEGDEQKIEIEIEEKVEKEEK